MTLHCLLAGVTLHCAPAAAAVTEADWVRRAGVLVAVIGTAVAAPEGTAVIWRWVRDATRLASRKARSGLARFLPFLRRSATVHPMTASAVSRTSATATATVTPGWDPDASLESRVQRLHEQMVWVYAEIDRARQEAWEGDTELRQMVEQHMGELRAAHQAHQAAHAAAQWQAAQVDARGVVLIGLGVMMTGIPDGLARFAVVGWLVVAASLALAIWWTYRAWNQYRADG